MLHLSAGLTAYILFITALLGLVMGSFAACMAGRLAAGESTLRGRSHCADCGHALSPRDLVPVFSWAVLRGRCRYCGAKIPVLCPTAELLCAGAFLGLVLRFDVSLAALEGCILTVLLLTAALVDWQAGWIPDRLLAAGVCNFVLFSLIEGGGAALLTGLLGGAALALPLLAMVLVMDRVLKRDSMGGGDLKLFFVVGLYFSWREALFILILCCLLGILFALVSKKTTGDPENPKAFPFGPAIAAGAYLSLLAAQPAVAWYLRLF